MTAGENQSVSRVQSQINLEVGDCLGTANKKKDKATKTNTLLVIFRVSAHFKWP